MINNKLKGMGVALITPFKSDETIDFDALARTVAHQIDNGTDYLVVLGTTAETPTLSEQEKNEVTKFIVNCNAGRLPVVLGVGGNSTNALVEKIKTTDFTGIDAILSVTPYYNKPTQEGLYRHYAALAQVSPLPIVLYNVPSRTGVNMLSSTTLRLAKEFKNICAIKEASGNLAQVDELIKAKPDDFMVISGDDALTFPMITLGAVGVISVIANAFPSKFGTMVNLALKGETEQARHIHQSFIELIALAFVEGNPAGVKSMLNIMGYIENVLRLPLIPNTDQTFEKINQILDK